jgi:hypothetical protein
MPGAMPAAEASHNANLFVSAENSQFSNYFGGPMVVEIVINDPALSDTDEGKGEPDITVNGKDVRMVQATDGLWYAYIADVDMARIADETADPANGVTAEVGLDFGEFCSSATNIDDEDADGGTIVLTDTVGIAIPVDGDGDAINGITPTAIPDCGDVVATTVEINNVVREQKSPSSPTIGASVEIGQIGLEAATLWPFIQLYDFTPTGNVVVKYNKGGGSQTTTLTFDTMDTFSSISLDRSVYPTGTQIHATLTDGQLNIDPTDEDSWTFATAISSPNVKYQVFDENGAELADSDAAATGDLLADNLSSLMFEDNGLVKLNPGVQAEVIIELDENTDQDLAALTATPAAAATGGGAFAATTQPVTFVETGANTGIFENSDESDDANIQTMSTASRGKSASIDYNKRAQSIVVGFGYGTLSLGLADAEWNSGEEIPVSLVDSDSNKNSRVDEDLDVNDPATALIPALRIGLPFTLAGSDDAEIFNIRVSNTDAITGLGVGLGSIQGGAISIGTGTDVESVETFSDRAIITQTTTGSTTAAIKTALVIDLNADIGDLQESIKDPQGTSSATRFKGLNLLNYDLRSLTAEDDTFVSVSAYLIVNRTGTGDTVLALDDFDIITTTSIVAISLGNSTSAQGIINLNTTSTVTAGTGAVVAATAADSDDVYDNLFAASPTNLATDDIALMFVFNPTGVYDFDLDDDPIVADFFTFGITGDGFKTNERTNNALYRFELEETGDNTSTFAGTAEFVMLNQLNIFDDSVYTNLRTVDDEVTFVVHEDLTDEDAPRVNYLDLGADGVSTAISAQVQADTHSGVVSFDKETYKVADIVEVTLEDQDLNVDSDLIDIYVTVDSTTDTANDAIGIAGSGTYTNGDAFGRLLDITFDDNRWVDGDNDGSDSDATADCADIDSATNTAPDDGLADAGFTLVETGPATGVFTGSFDIPSVYCDPAAPAAAGVSVTGLDLEVNYVDFRDASGETIETGDGAGVRANTGSISLDRTVYPVPFGKLGDFATTGTGTTPTQGDVKRSIFPIHSSGIDVGETGSPDLDETVETLAEGDLSIHVRVNDPDFDQSPGENTIATTSGFGPIKITVARGADSVILSYAGRDTAHTGLIDAGTKSTVDTAIREAGPITETGPATGIFELDFSILYTDGPSDSKCPTTLSTGFTASDGGTDTTETDRFDVAAASGEEYCILQGDILTVEYTDPTDASGDINTVTDSATFDLRNGVLQSDKSVYIIGADAILTLIEPDLDLDSDGAESYDLDLIEWDSDAATITMGDLGTESAKFDPEPSEFRETGDSTGIFQIVVEIPNTLDGNTLDRGEEIQLEYTDWGPSGADYVGDEEEDINVTIYTSNFGATVELDQKVYTWTDKVFITIVAPDHNFDSNLVDEIGETSADKIVVATRGDKIDSYKLVETGTDTGIFTGEVILTGFTAGDFDADGDGDGPDATGTGPTGDGPTDGVLPADDDDGLTVSFEFTEDETVVGSALVRWNIGEVQFLEASYPATGQGVIRVVDPDLNLNPEAVDNFNVDVWSDSDAGGIDLTVTETNEATGIFEGTVFFTVTDESSGHRLKP